MEINENRIVIDKELTKLDKFVLDFIKILNKLKIGYVIVSGYVSILLGRSRATEDVDILLPKLSFEEFEELYKNLGNFECVDTDIKDAYESLKEGSNARFFKKGTFIPNIEIKFTKNELDEYILKNKHDIIIKKELFHISPLYLQIPYKLFLGSEKDIEDARFLYQMFKDKMNTKEFISNMKKLKVFKKSKLLS